MSANGIDKTQSEHKESRSHPIADMKAEAYFDFLWANELKIVYAKALWDSGRPIQLLRKFLDQCFHPKNFIATYNLDTAAFLSVMLRVYHCSPNGIGRGGFDLVRDVAKTTLLGEKSQCPR